MIQQQLMHSILRSKVQITSTLTLFAADLLMLVLKPAENSAFLSKEEKWLYFTVYYCIFYQINAGLLRLFILLQKIQNKQKH